MNHVKCLEKAVQIKCQDIFLGEKKKKECYSLQILLGALRDKFRARYFISTQVSDKLFFFKDKNSKNSSK